MNKFLSLLPCLLAGMVVTGVVQADSHIDKKKAIENGAGHYRIFCINCHGPEADGNGPLVALLKIKPADLTMLKQNKANNQSISERVFNAVNGRHKVGEGEERNMPVFNENLEINTVMEIADFIEVIQK